MRIEWDVKVNDDVYVAPSWRSSRHTLYDRLED